MVVFDTQIQFSVGYWKKKKKHWEKQEAVSWYIKV